IDLPWPFARVEKVKVSQLREVQLATMRPPEGVRHILWTNDHQVKDETKLLVRTSTSLAQASGLTGSAVDEARSLIVIEVPLHYRVRVNADGSSGLESFEKLAVPGSRDALIRSIAQREILKYLTTLTEDQILSSGRTAANAELKNRISAALDAAGAGVEVTFVAIEGVHPPRGNEGATALSYEQIVSDQVRATTMRQFAELDATAAQIKAAGSVENAQAIVREIDRLSELSARKASEAEINAQQAKLDGLISGAGGEAAQILARAQADRWTRVMAARGRAEAYAGRLSAFQANPDLYMFTMYLDTLRDVVKDARLYIVHDQVHDLRVQTDLKDLGSTVDVFSTENR
nr:SPFH domain-containing protein [Phycisphaerales bacterium]